MSVWVCFPSKRPVADVNAILKVWHERGYFSAVARDVGDEPVDATLTVMQERYEGWGAAINMLAKKVFDLDRTCDWIVGAADDIEPDPTHDPGVIAQECSAYFAGLACFQHRSCGCLTCADRTRTWGVMQPTGDRFAGGSIDRICGSPWIGREFCGRMYGGRGAFNPEYRHMFVDEELQEVAIKLGVLWQRPDLVHLHLHFMREHRGLAANATRTEVPPHLMEANTREHWDKYKAIFQARKAAGFPGHEPIA